MKTNHYTNLLAQLEKLVRHNRQGAFKTKERYDEAYRRFLRFVAIVYRLEKIANLSGKHLSAYVKHMKSKGYAPGTIKTDLSAIRFWHDQIPNAKYKMPPNSEFDLERRKFGGVNRTWNSAEFDRWVEVCREKHRADYEACFIVARHTGLRIHEVMRIDTATARAALKKGFLTTKGKGGKVRAVPINDVVRSVLHEWITCTSPGQKLFVPTKKQTHIAIKELQNFIIRHRKTVQDPDSTRPMTFHGLRHTYCPEQYSVLVSDGKTDRQARSQISKWTGHERADVTRIYLPHLSRNSRERNNEEGGDSVE